MQSPKKLLIAGLCTHNSVRRVAGVRLAGATYRFSYEESVSCKLRGMTERRALLTIDTAHTPEGANERFNG
jgi:hypothetical protein